MRVVLFWYLFGVAKRKTKCRFEILEKTWTLQIPELKNFGNTNPTPSKSGKNRGSSGDAKSDATLGSDAKPGKEWGLESFPVPSPKAVPTFGACSTLSSSLLFLVLSSLDLS